MKQLILINLFIATLFVFIAGNVAAENNETRYYNYYHRNLDGTFILEQIDNTVVPLFSYKVEYEDGSIYSVTGFYYNTEIIKFIDLIKNSRIIQSEYFDKNSEIIYIKKNMYKDDFLSFIKIQYIKEYFTFESVGTEFKKGWIYVWIFFEKNLHAPNYFYTAIHSQEKPPFVNTNDTNDNENRHSVSSGVFTADYKPVYVNSKVMFREDYALKHELVTETYAYNSDGKLMQYLIYRDNRKWQVLTITESDGTEIEVFQHFQGWFGEYAYEVIDAIRNGIRYSVETKDIQSKDIKSIEITRESNRIQRLLVIKDDLRIAYNFDKLGKNETGRFYLKGSDEIVDFRADKSIDNSKLSFEKNIFPYPSYFF